MNADTPSVPTRRPDLDADEVAPAAVTRWSAQLADPQVEADYLVDHFPEDRRRFLFVLFFFALSGSLNLAGDLYAIRYLGANAGVELVSQFAFLAVTLSTALLVGRVSSPQVFQWLAIAYVAIGIAAMLTTLSVHPRLGPVWPTMMIGVVIVIYFCVPLPFMTMVALALGYSIVAPLTWNLWLGVPSPDDMYRVLTRLLLANILGFTVAHTLQRSQRIQFAQNRLLQKLLSTDALTGIANRRRFDRALQDEWRRCARARVPLSLLMIDVDYFKDYNDHCGHVQGDECLRRIAAILTTASRRPGDLVARYGGEEFACLLVDTGADGALHVAERLQAAVAAARIPHPGSPLGRHLTISIGAATARPPAGQSGTLIARADRALYAAKHRGRNTIVSEGMSEVALARPGGVAAAG